MQNGERRLRRRFFALTVVFAGGLGLLGLYLFTMQIVRGGEFQQRARDVSSREAVIPAQRGKVFDRNADVPLVFNVDSFAVDLSPAEVPEAQLPALLELAPPHDLHREEVESQQADPSREDHGEREEPPALAALAVLHQDPSLSACLKTRRRLRRANTNGAARAL